MRVGTCERTHHGGSTRLAMHVTWEDRAAPDDTIWFDFSDDADEDILASADVSLLAAFPLAMWYGERQLIVEGDVTPRLADGVRAAMALIAERTPTLRPVTLALTERTHPVVETSTRRRPAALCMSGGVDALSALEENLRTTTAPHSARYGRGVFAFGLNSYDFHDGQPRTERRVVFDAMATRLERFLGVYGLSLTRVTTNLRSLFPHFQAWWAVAHDTPLAAIGHAMRAGVHSLAIASSGVGVGPGVTPHPLMGALLATPHLDVHAAQLMLSRLEKVRRIAAWPEALSVLRVCLHIDLPSDGQINCGRCEKCLRTMLQLLAVDSAALSQAPFPSRDVSAAEIEQLSFDFSPARNHYPPLVPLLAARGRTDLSQAVERALARWERQEPAPDVRPWWRIGGP